MEEGADSHVVMTPKYEQITQLILWADARRKEGDVTNEETVVPNMDSWKWEGAVLFGSREAWPNTTWLSNFNMSFSLWMANVVPTNLVAAPLKGGIQFRSVEHAYQAHKFVDSTHILQVASAPSPRHAKAYAYKHQKDWCVNWWEINAKIMKKCIMAKIRQNAAIREHLLKTGDAPIIEVSFAGDTYWGTRKSQIANESIGVNLLGRIWMEARDTIRTEEEALKRRVAEYAGTQTPKVDYRPVVL